MYFILKIMIIKINMNNMFYVVFKIDKNVPILDVIN